MNTSKFVYVTYIRTTPEDLWKALITPQFQKQYWFGASQSSDWTVGSAWEMRMPDGKLGDSGEILQSDPPHRLVIKWRVEHTEEMRAEGYLNVSFDLLAMGASVKLTVVTDGFKPGSVIQPNMEEGWALLLSNLKTLLETGRPLELSV